VGDGLPAVAFALVAGMGLRTIRARPSGVQAAAHRLRDGLAAGLDPRASAAPPGEVAGRRRGLPGAARSPL